VIYEDFISRKLATDVPTGIADPSEPGDHLFPYQRDLVRWSLRRGRAAVFADCGMGKGPMALEWAHHVAVHTDRPVIILAPLAVAQQFVREGEKFGRPVRYARDASELSGSIVVTNYERLDKFDPAIFGGVVCDESSILKHHDARTRTEIISAFSDTAFRLSCTATPSPNDHRELGGQAHFLGVMTEAEMLARYFVHDGEKSSGQGWRLKGHAKRVFWRWVCSWAAMIRRPSDLGYSDDGYALPPLRYHSHVTATDMSHARANGVLFVEEAKGIQGRRSARRASMDDRVSVAARLVTESPNDEQWLIWCGLNAEGDALADAIPGAVQVAGSDPAEVKEQRLVDFAEGRTRVLVTKVSIAGFGINLQRCRNMAFVGMSDSFEEFYQAVRRCYRFGQARDVNVHVIASEAEGGIVANVQRKADDAAAMADAMIAEMREMMRAEVRGASRDTDDYMPTVPMNVPAWLTDNVEAS
jgi:superfamily II DNA or RNA helicase